jgi:serine/threonine protein kinase
MTASSNQLATLIEAHLAGEHVDVPSELRTEFNQAVAAHEALRGMLDETFLNQQSSESRLPPNMAGAYDIERELGHGGMGVVYLARQRSLNRRVALKVLRPGERTFGPIVKRFLDEARHLAQLRHPNIVSIHEVGDAEGEPYFTMDFIDGETLSSVIACGPLPPTRAVDILKQVAAGVQHAHRHGIIHRDLKPGNVLLDQSGQVFVTDFGLARNVSQESNLTQSGELLGTPQYMSPEQARGQTSLVGEATDIHALGLLLFEMLLGRAAFGAKSPADVLVKLLNEDPPPLRTIDRRIPRDLETICLKALQKTPAARYVNVSALLEDVRRFEAGEPLLARRTSVFVRIGRWAKRGWKLATAMLVTTILVAAIAPRLFDKSVEDLIAWGSEELRDGRPEVALQVFQRAWSRGDESQRRQIVPQYTEAIRKSDNPRAALDAALTIIKFDPDLSFGKHDYLVASALALEARTETQNGYFEPPHHDTPPAQIAKRELVARRLAKFLDGASGTADQRVDAEKTLQAIRVSLRGVLPAANWLDSFDAHVKVPEGTLTELSQRAADAAIPPWERAKATLAIARLHEAANDRNLALATYRSALEEIRRLYPFVAGVVSDFQNPSLTTNTARPDAPECQLVRDVLDSIHRLDPSFSTDVTGGIRIRLEQAELLGRTSVTIRPLLSDEGIKSPNEGLHRYLSTSVPMNRDAPSEIRVLPGRYRLSLEGRSFSWSTSDVNPRLIELDADAWPKTVDIGDKWIDLTLSVRKLDEIKFTMPAAGSPIDLTKDTISWTAIPGAVEYAVHLVVYSDLPNPTVTGFHGETTSEPMFRPSSTQPRDLNIIRTNWPSGSTIGLRIAAVDASGKQIAISIEERKYLVAIPL